MFIRPVTRNDHDALMVLAQKAGHGMTSLPQDADVLRDKIETSEASFANTPPGDNEHRFLLVMEDEDSGEIVGSTGIKSRIGLSSPFYSYKISTLVQASSDPKVYSLNRVLHMVNDYTGVSEIGALFLRKSYRRDGLGKCLSRCRFLMVAEFEDLFADIIIAEMRGVHDAEGNSPFYDHLARDFFQMSFRQADYTNAVKGGQFIADLMPKYPIYEKLLAPEAQAVIGEVNDASRPAKMLLEREGFHYEGYVDIFDAGPTIQAEARNIRTVQASHHATVDAIVGTLPDSAEKHILMTTELANLRMTQGHISLDETGHHVTLSQTEAKNLGVSKGDTLRIVRA